MASKNSISSFPLMLINSGKHSWIPSHLWSDSQKKYFLENRNSVSGSLFRVPVFCKERFHRSPDYKGRWIYAEDEKSPDFWCELQRYNFGYQFDLLQIGGEGSLSVFKEALSLLISGVILSSGTDVLRAFPDTYGKNDELTQKKIEVLRGFGNPIDLFQINRKVIYSTEQSPLDLEKVSGIEILPVDWWQKEEGKKNKPGLKYIEINRKRLDQKILDQMRKPAKRRKRGIISRLFVPRT